MRTSLLLVVVVLAGCGNWSNSDLTFANALPRTDDLKATVPASTAQPLLGVGTRQDGLMVGDPSNAYAQTVKAAEDFNATLLALLGIVDQVRQFPPTIRTPDSRTWGPYDDTNNAGRQVQVVITQVDEVSFTWQIDSRAKTEQRFLTVLKGTFEASETARRGQGHLEVPVASFRDVVTVDEGFKQIDAITMEYRTAQNPKEVQMLFDLKEGNTLGVDALRYVSRQRDDGVAGVQFLYARTDTAVSKLEISARYVSSGAGRSVGIVREGAYVGATVAECWDSAKKVTYYAEGWPGGMVSGAESSCEAIDSLE